MLVGSLATVATAKLPPMPVKALDFIGLDIVLPTGVCAYVTGTQMPRLKDGEVQTVVLTIKWNGPGGPDFRGATVNTKETKRLMELSNATT